MQRSKFRIVTLKTYSKARENVSQAGENVSHDREISHFPTVWGSALSLGLLLILAVSVNAEEEPAAIPNRVTIEKRDDRCRVLIGDDLFTEYIFRGYEKPILYPILGPHGIGMTRNFPMRKEVAGESTDHPHHKSLWYAHRPINGIDFWSDRSTAGKCVQDKLLEIQSGARRGLIRTSNRWVKSDGTVVFTDMRVLSFESFDSARAIDWSITLKASHGPVTFGDSKEGTMAIRTHPNLRLENNPRHGVTTANGQAVNSRGVRGKEVWGKRADWIDYWGTVEGKTVGIAIFDHPTNPRHPTHWMARQYGYIGANPFGLNAFEGKPPGTGQMTIPDGKEVTFRYRFLFHEGDPDAAQIPQRYDEYSKSPSSRPRSSKRQSVK